MGSPPMHMGCADSCARHDAGQVSERPRWRFSAARGSRPPTRPKRLTPLKVSGCLFGRIRGAAVACRTPTGLSLRRERPSCPPRIRGRRSVGTTAAAPFGQHTQGCGPHSAVPRSLGGWVSRSMVEMGITPFSDAISAYGGPRALRTIFVDHTTVGKRRRDSAYYPIERFTPRSVGRPFGDSPRLVRVALANANAVRHRSEGVPARRGRVRSPRLGWRIRSWPGSV